MKSLKNRFHTVAKIENRMICPACPVAVERAVFIYDYEMGNKLIQFVLRNNGPAPVSGAVVRFRCYDDEGNCLYPGATPEFTITYTGLSCGSGEYFADRRAVKLFSYDIVNYEACVTEVTFVDGSSTVYSPEDYIERPPRALLRNLLDDAGVRGLRRAWGREARCVPIAVTPDIWMCTCGRVCTEAVCPACSCAKETLAPYFGDSATRAYAAALSRRRRLRGTALLSAAGLLAAAACVGAGWYAAKVAYPAATADITDRFLAGGRYNEALAFARKRGDDACIGHVIDAAIEAALAERDYAGALLYDSILDTPSPERIYRRAAEDAMAGTAGGAGETPDFAAASYGLLTADETLYDALIHTLIDYCEESGLYRQAARYTRMLHDRGQETQIAIFDEAIAESMASRSYDEALSWASQHPNSLRYDEVLREIFTLFFDAGDLDSALTYAAYGEDNGYYTQILEAADERFIAQHITQLYFFMSEQQRRAYHAQPVAVCKEAAYIDASGNVRGLKDVNWSHAVSLAMNEFHTLCLFDNGRVEAAGNTGYGRCSVSSWENIVSVAAGERHSVGLRATGQVSAVGDNSAGQCNVSGWRAVVSVAAGKYHTVALRADGTLLATGDNSAGQCNVSGYADIIAVAAGDWTTVLLHRDGSVTVLGSRALGIADAENWQDIVAVAAGSSHVLGLCADGSVKMAGRPVSGSAGSTEDWTNVTAISAGSVCVAGLRGDGTLYLSGDGAPALN